jgi:putative spermidine/putrescine transport system permease protein
VRGAILLVVGGIFLVPIVAMAEFTLREQGGGYGLSHWADLLHPARPQAYDALWQGLRNSVVLALATIAIVLLLLAPTMVLVQLRFARWRRVMEFVCLLPIALPSIALVVGLAPVYLVVGRTFGTGIWSLAFAYGITCLPFAYRAIQANLDAVATTTLAEAARSLGAGWGTVLLRVIAPNVRRGLMLAALISVAVVLGEFTIASLLNRPNLQTALVVVSKIDPYVTVIMSLLSLGLVFLLLLAIDRIGHLLALRAGR